MYSIVRKIFILDDVKSFLKGYKEMVPHFNLRSVDFTLLTTSWSELVEHPELPQSSLILIDFTLDASSGSKGVPSIQSQLNLKEGHINGFDIARVCKEIAKDSVIKILTANPKLAIQTLKSNPTYSSVCDVSDIIQKPLTLRCMANLIETI